MSFEKKNVLALRKVAKQTGVDLGDATKKAEIIALLEADGVTEEYYNEKFPEAGAPVKEEPKAEKAEKKEAKTVIQLVTGWALLQSEWGTVTQSQPFLVVTPDEAAAAVATGDFKKVTPEEVKKAYSLGS